jgi:hypothetical protein
VYVRAGIPLVGRILLTVLPAVLLGPPPAAYFWYNSNMCFGGVKTFPAVGTGSFGGRSFRICWNTFRTATSGSSVISAVAQTTVGKYNRKRVVGNNARLRNLLPNIFTASLTSWRKYDKMIVDWNSVLCVESVKWIKFAFSQMFRKWNRSLLPLL